MRDAGLEVSYIHREIGISRDQCFGEEGWHALPFVFRGIGRGGPLEPNSILMMKRKGAWKGHARAAGARLHWTVGTTRKGKPCARTGRLKLSRVYPRLRSRASVSVRAGTYVAWPRLGVWGFDTIDGGLGAAAARGVEGLGSVLAWSAGCQPVILPVLAKKYLT